MAMQDQGLAGSSGTQIVKKPFDSRRWELVWQDEFNVDGRPNPNKWSYEEGYIRNNEKQFYTKERLENAKVSGGKLTISALKDNWNGKPITSASLTTKGKYEFRYGRVEVRAKVPTGKGTWPAIWTLGTNIQEIGWPRCGELDIMEYVGYDPNTIHANVHMEKYNHTKGTGKGNRISVPNVWNEFHVYAVDWTPGYVEFFVDDQRYFRFDREPNATNAEWPFDKDQYLILNLAIGGAWGGQQGVDESLFPHRFEIDYVRIFKEKK
jgi:beta-glucanase (GH16 family)